MQKNWIIKAEVNMDASNTKTVGVRASTKKTAMNLAEKKLKRDGAFHVRIESCLPSDPAESGED